MCWCTMRLQQVAHVNFVERKNDESKKGRMNEQEKKKGKKKETSIYSREKPKTKSIVKVLRLFL